LIDDIAKLLPAGFNRFHEEGLDSLLRRHSVSAAL
jgi:hypothetical protein